MVTILAKILLVQVLFFGCAWLGGVTLAHASLSIQQLMTTAMQHVMTNYPR